MLKNEMLRLLHVTIVFFIEDSCYKTQFVVFSFFHFLAFYKINELTVLQVIQTNTSFTGIPSNIHLYRKTSNRKTQVPVKSQW